MTRRAGWIVRVMASIALAATVLACRTDTLSIEEAKGVTAQFEEGFVPPPRSIRDIADILKEAESQESEQLAEAKSKLDAPPPEDADARTLRDFYYHRGALAMLYGRTRQAEQDLKRSLELLQSKAGGRAKYATTRGYESATEEVLYRALSHTFAVGGNFDEAVTYRLRALDEIPASSRGRLLITQASAAYHFVHIGDVRTAEKYLEKAKRNLSRGSNSLNVQSLYATCEGNVFAAKGLLAESEASYRNAIDKITRALSRGAPRGRSDIGLTYEQGWLLIKANGERMLANSLMHQGRLSEAEVHVRKALAYVLEAFGRYSSETAIVLIELGRILQEKARFTDAELILRETVASFSAVGASNAGLRFAEARAELAEALFHQGKWNEGLEQFETIASAMREEAPKSFTGRFDGHPSWMTALIRTGRAAQALSPLERQQSRKLEYLDPDTYEVAEIRGLLAVASVEMGKIGDALRYFSDSVPVLLTTLRQSRHSSKGRAVRDARIAFVLESYIRFLEKHRSTELFMGAGIDAISESFRVASTIQARSVQRALTDASARATPASPELADLVRREQDTELQIAALWTTYADAMSGPRTEQKQSAADYAKTQIETLEAARSALVQEIETKFPNYAEITRPKPATVVQTRQALHAGEALILAYTGDEQTFVWAFGKDGPLAFASSPIGYTELSEIVASLRASLDPQVDVLGDIPRFDVKTAHALYEALLKPVEAGWKPAENILFVPHGPLGFLPLSVLPTEHVELAPEHKPLFSEHADIPWLAKTHAVTTLPSALALKLLRGVPAPLQDRKPVVAFADPVFAPDRETAHLVTDGTATRSGKVFRFRNLPKTRSAASADISVLPPLPDTAEEVRSLALAMNANLTQSVFLGKAANEDQVKTMDLSGYKVVAFATHGLVPGDLDGLLQPALALSNPAVTETRGDGLLTMDEIMGLKLDADWVVLSACNTGAAEGAGAEAMSGLGRAFFYAGTRALLVSNWPVETTSAKALTTDLFRRQAADSSLSRAEALRQAMLALMESGFVDPDSGKTVFSYAHPIFWAPFSLVGDGGGEARTGS